MTNADMDSHSPFACLLVGQPTLRRRIKLGTFAALEEAQVRTPVFVGLTGVRRYARTRSSPRFLPRG